MMGDDGDIYDKPDAAAKYLWLMNSVLGCIMDNGVDVRYYAIVHY